MAASLQVVFVLWGTKYSAAHVNALARALRAQASGPLRLLCLTDRHRPDLDAEQQLIPPDFDRPEFRSRGCQAKLSIFEPGVLDPAMPALLLDLDTMIMGDVLRFLPLLRRPGLYMLPATWGAAWPLLRLLSPVLPVRWRGNSSVVLFKPSDWFHVPHRFLREWAENPKAPHVSADDKFLSVLAGRHLRRVPPHLAVKFVNEFGSRLPLVAELTGRLPWVARRRRNLVALTFSGGFSKPERLRDLPIGARLAVGKRRVVVWSPGATSGMMQPIRQHWSDL